MESLPPRRNSSHLTRSDFLSPPESPAARTGPKGRRRPPAPPSHRARLFRPPALTGQYCNETDRAPVPSHAESRRRGCRTAPAPPRRRTETAAAGADDVRDNAGTGSAESHLPPDCHTHRDFPAPNQNERKSSEARSHSLFPLLHPSPESALRHCMSGSVPGIWRHQTMHIHPLPRGAADHLRPNRRSALSGTKKSPSRSGPRRP